MTGHETERLSAYLDGDLSPAEREELKAHLAGCTECAATLVDLERIVVGARSLEDRPPGRDLWPGIAQRLERSSEPAVTPLASRRRGAFRRFSFTLPELAAAAVALMVLSGGAVWWARSDGGADRAETTASAGSTSAPADMVLAADKGEAGYAAAIAQLERVFEESKDRLDPETVRAVEANLAIIDQAILQTQQALETDPNSTYLHGHLANTRQQKIEVLRDAANIIQTSI